MLLQRAHLKISERGYLTLIRAKFFMNTRAKHHFLRYIPTLGGGMFFYYYYRTHQNIREWSNTRGMHILRYYFWAIHPPPPPTGFSFSPQEELLGWDSNSTSGMLHSSRSAGVIKWAGRKPRLRWLCADRTSMRPFLLAVLRLNNAFLSALTTVVIKAKTNFYRRTRVVLGREFVYFRDKGFSGLFLSGGFLFVTRIRCRGWKFM